MPFSAALFYYVTTYGYLAIFIGAIFEGETLVILGGLFASQGHLSLPAVLTLSFFGALIGDSAWFLAGRYRLPKFLFSRPWFIKLSNKPLEYIHAKPRLLIFSMRFMYGFRTLLPLGFGLSNIPTKLFLTYNTLGTFVWVMIYSNLGYFFGTVLQVLFGRIRHFELLMIALVMVAVIAFMTISRMLRTYLNRRLKEEEISQT